MLIDEPLTANVSNMTIDVHAIGMHKVLYFEMRVPWLLRKEFTICIPAICATCPSTAWPPGGSHIRDLP